MAEVGSYETQREKVYFQQDNPSNYSSKKETKDGIKYEVEGYIVKRIYDDGRVYEYVERPGGEPGMLINQYTDPKVREEYQKNQAVLAGKPSPELASAQAQQAQLGVQDTQTLQAEKNIVRDNGMTGFTNKEWADYQDKLADNARQQQQIANQTAAQAASAAAQADTNQVSRERIAADRATHQEDIGVRKEDTAVRREDIKARSEDAAAGRELTGRQVAEQEAEGAFKRGDYFDWQQQQAKAQEERARLTNLIEMRKLTDAQANTMYNRWWQENVVLPFKNAEEGRLRSAEERQLQTMQDQADQFAATNSLARGQLGNAAGNEAVNQYISTFPYRGGPNLGANLSGAINSLSHGSSAGVNFSPEDFNFKAEDNDSVYARRAAQALKGVSSYARNIVMQGEGRTQTPMPSIDLSQAPKLPEGFQLPGLQGTTTQDMLDTFTQSYKPPEDQAA